MLCTHSCHFLLGVCVDRNHVGSGRWLGTRTSVWANTSNCHNWYSQIQLASSADPLRGCACIALWGHIIFRVLKWIFKGKGWVKGVSAFWALFWNWQIKTKLAKYRQRKLAYLMHATSDVRDVSEKEDVRVVSKYITQFMHSPCRRVNRVTGDACSQGSCSVTGSQLNPGKFV